MHTAGKEGSMKIQRKLLTKKQKNEICNRHSKDGKCNGAGPLAMNFICFVGLEKIEKDIKNFWNEEIELEDS